MAELLRAEKVRGLCCWPFREKEGSWRTIFVAVDRDLLDQDSTSAVIVVIGLCLALRARRQLKTEKKGKKKKRRGRRGNRKKETMRALRYLSFIFRSECSVSNIE